MSEARPLTKRQQQFIWKVSAGTPPIDAAELVFDCKSRSSAASLARNMLSNPKILTALQERVTGFFVGDLQPLAVKVFKELLESDDTTDKLRFDVAKYVNDKAEELHKMASLNDIAAQNVNAMTEEELIIFIKRSQTVITRHKAADELGLIEGEFERIS